MMSLNQWTPLRSLATTINIIKEAISILTKHLTDLRAMHLSGCIIAVDITHNTSTVVEDG